MTQGSSVQNGIRPERRQPPREGATPMATSQTIDPLTDRDRAVSPVTLATPDLTTSPLAGPPTATAPQAKRYARQRGARRLDDLGSYVDEVWRLGTMVGYDPAVIFAQFCDETGVGTAPHWVERLNPAGLGVLEDRWRPVHDLGIGFSTGVDAARAHIVHLSAYVTGYEPRLQPYLGLDPRWQAVFVAGYAGIAATIADLAGRWASNPRYAEQIAGHLRRLRDVSITPDVSDKSGGIAPLPLGIRQVATGNSHPRTQGQRPVAIVYHVTDDLDLANVSRWFIDPASRASAHVVIDRDGTIHQFVSSTRAAWTNGDFFTRLADGTCRRHHRTDIPWLVQALDQCDPFGPMNPNDFTLNIEHVGKPNLDFTEAQYASTIALSAYWRDRYGLRMDRGHLLRHADINPTSRGYCPGPLFDLTRVIRALGGDPGDLGGRR